MRKVFLAAGALLLTSFAFAAVDVKDGLVTANVMSEPVKQVITKIGEQSGIVIIVDDGVAGTTISANFRALTVGAAVKKMLEGTGINYAVFAGGDGKTTAIYISGSEKPGTPPKKLDTRPITASPNRGVVNPVNTMPPPPPMPTPVNNMDKERMNNPALNNPSMNRDPNVKPNDPNLKPNNPFGTSVPTAGSFAPAPNTSPKTEPLKPQIPDLLDEDDDDDE